MKRQFEVRLGRFGRVRRAVANGALACGIGVLALWVGIGALLLLRGWKWSSSPFVNAAIDAVPALAAVVLLVWLLVRLVRGWEGRRHTLIEAFRAEALEGDLNSRLVSAVDFLGWPQSSPLTDVVIRRAREDLGRPFEAKLDRTARNRALRRFVLLLVLFALLGSTPWFSFARLGRTVALCATNMRELLFPTRFEMFPGDKVYRLGAKAEVGLRFTRFGYSSVQMLTELSERGGVQTNTLTVTASGRAVETLQPTVERQYRIRFAFGNRVTEPMQLTFTTSPMIENMQVELVYPLYTRQVPKEIDGIVDRVTALSGTRINLGFVFNKPMKSAVLTFTGESNAVTRVPMDVVGRFSSVSFVHSQESKAQLRVEDIHGFDLDTPQNVEFGLTVDTPPKLILPKFLGRDMPLTLDALAGFTFGARVEDDFGAAKCVVKWNQATVEEPSRIKTQGEPIERPFIPPRPKAVAAFENIFREAAMNASPGDLFAFQVEAFDNREPKPQSTRSTEFTIFVKGAGLEMVGDAGGTTDIFGRFRTPGSGAGRGARYVAPEGPKGIKPIQKLDTAEGYVNEFRSDRSSDIRGDVRGGGMGSTAAEFGRAFTGAK